MSQWLAGLSVLRIERPAGASMDLAQSKIIGGDVLVAAGKSLFGDGELVHEGEAEVEEISADCTSAATVEGAGKKDGQKNNRGWWRWILFPLSLSLTIPRARRQFTPRG